MKRAMPSPKKARISAALGFVWFLGLKMADTNDRPYNNGALTVDQNRIFFRLFKKEFGVKPGRY